MLKENQLFIGKKIKSQRKKLKLTQFELAEKVGLHEKQISRIELGANSPTLDNFFKIIEALNLKLEDFSLSSTKNSETKEELLAIIHSSDEKSLRTYLVVLKALISDR